MITGRDESRIVIVGAGVAGVEVMLGLAELAPDWARLEIVAPEDEFVYRPLAVAETFAAGTPFSLAVDRIAAHVGARHRRERLLAVDERRKVLHLSTGDEVTYDLLVLACGARPEKALPGALTFRGPEDENAFRAVLAEFESGALSTLAFVVPPGTTWQLPLYELALFTATRVDDRTRIVFVTPEARPLERFGSAATDLAAELLETASIEVHCNTYAASFVGTELRLVPDGRLEAERVVSLPRLRGPRVEGVAHDADGFLPTDLHGLVHGSADVYAAGDATSFPIKLGGIAVEQAGAVAEAIAARLGAGVRPTPFRPLLRGLLLSGGAPHFLWVDPAGGRGETSAATPYPLWWPPGKIAGGRLAGYLRAEGLPVPAPPAGPATAPVVPGLPARR